jgi:DNA repair exonuclease SbcCD ATPase subunit
MQMDQASKQQLLQQINKLEAGVEKLQDAMDNAKPDDPRQEEWQKLQIALAQRLAALEQRLAVLEQKEVLILQQQQQQASRCLSWMMSAPRVPVYQRVPGIHVTNAHNLGQVCDVCSSQDLPAVYSTQYFVCTVSAVCALLCRCQYIHLWGPVPCRLQI